MPEISGAHALALGLEKMGAKRLYGIIGTSILGFFEGLYPLRERIRYISCRHEQVAASMADVEGRLTGRPGVAIVHSGPGALNALISVGNAYKDCSPMILITGAVKSRLQGTDGMLEADHLRIFAPFVKAAFRIQRTEQIPMILSKAFNASLLGTHGPVVIEVPEDVWKERASIDEDAYSFEQPTPTPPDEKELRKMLKALQSAKRPLLLAGAGIADARACPDLEGLVDLLQVPVVTTGNGRGVLREDHPLSLGRMGFGGGNPVADRAYQEADCIVGLGCGISDMVTYEFTQQTDADIYLINLDAASSNRKAYIESHVLADVGLALKDLLRMAREESMGPLSAWTASGPVAEERARWQSMLEGASAIEGVPLSPSFVLSKLAPLLPRDTIVTGGAGMHVTYAHNYLPSFGPRQFLAAVNFGAMGFALPAAMGAKLCHPERTVLSVIGDGDFIMTVQDLETIAREKIGIKILVINDNSYRVLEFKQKMQYQGHVLGTSHGNPDFLALAKAFGLKGLRIEKPSDVLPGLKEMMETEGPVLVEVVTDPDDLPPTNLEAVLKMGQA